MDSLLRSKHLQASHMGIFPVHVICSNHDLHRVDVKWTAMECKCLLTSFKCKVICTELAVFTRPLCSNVEGDPSGWLVHCDSLHLLKIIQTCPGPDKKLNRCIGVVGEDIQIDGKFLQQRNTPWVL